MTACTFPCGRGLPLSILLCCPFRSMVIVTLLCSERLYQSCQTWKSQSAVLFSSLHVLFTIGLKPKNSVTSYFFMSFSTAVSTAEGPCHIYLSRLCFCRNPRGIFLDKVPGEFCGGFLGEFFGAFFLGKNRRKNPPKNPRQTSDQNLGVSRPKSTLQGSALDDLLRFNMSMVVVVSL